MIERFFPELHDNFGRRFGQVMSGQDGVPIFILTTVGKYFSWFRGFHHTVGPGTEFRIFFTGSNHPLQIVQ